MQVPRPKRKYTRRKDPAEVSARDRAAGMTLVEYEGEMIPAIVKAGRISGELQIKYLWRCMSLCMLPDPDGNQRCVGKC
jgi:hypothetical protein